MSSDRLVLVTCGVLAVLLVLGAAGLVLGLLAATVTDGIVGASSLHRMLALGVAVLPVAVGLGWVDARDAAGERTRSTLLFLGLSLVVVGVLVASAPLRSLGGTLFLLVPILLTVTTGAVVIAAIPLYVLGAAGANARQARGSNRD
jgi:hypothetical protein